MKNPGMRRSEALQGILGICQEWDGSMPELKMAEQILTFLEKKAHVNTYWFETVYDKSTQKDIDLVHPGWRPEKKGKRGLRSKS